MFSLLLLFLFLPFWFGTQKGEDGPFYSTEGSPTHSLQCSDRCRVNAGHKADPIGFLLALIDCFFGWCQVPGSAYEATGNTALYPPKGPETGHHSFIGEKSIPAHHLVPRALPSYKGWFP
jgi:hypothetical protein